MPSYREGVDDITGIEVDHSAASLPVLSQTSQSPEMYTPVASTSASTFGSPSVSHFPRGNVLLETIGVIQLHFFLPPHLLPLLHPAHLTAHRFLTVRIPTLSWYSSQFTKVDVFHALCREISSACVGNEALDDHLIYRTIRALRKRVWMEFRGIINRVECRSAEIPYGEVGNRKEDDGTRSDIHRGTRRLDRPRTRRLRRLHCYDPQGHERNDFGYAGTQRGKETTKQVDIGANKGGALILRQQDPDGSELGVAIWESGGMSLVPSYMVLFHFPETCLSGPGGKASGPLLPPHPGPRRSLARVKLPPSSPQSMGFDMGPPTVEMTLDDAVQAAQRTLFQDY